MSTNYAFICDTIEVQSINSNNLNNLNLTELSSFNDLANLNNLIFAYSDSNNNLQDTMSAFGYDTDLMKKALSLNQGSLEDMKNSEELKLEEFNNRSMIKKVKESIARLFSPIL